MERFPQNARVCFIGDSITHLNNYIAYISAFYHRQFPDDNINFYNCGVAGGTLSTQLAILEEDAFACAPTHAAVMIGINDSCRVCLADKRSREKYAVLKEAFEGYKANLNLLCSRLLEKKIHIILCTPTPYDEYLDSEIAPLPGGYALMASYAAFIREYAKEKGLDLCDYHAYITEKMQEQTLYQPDRVHPNLTGQYYIGKCFLESQGLTHDELMDIPEYMEEWSEKVMMLRNIAATEHIIIQNYNLSTKERISFINTFLSKNYTGQVTDDYLEMLSREYLICKPQQQKLASDSNMLMEICFKDPAYRQGRDTGH